jgi:small conductance mechanosensitive channel
MLMPPVTEARRDKLKTRVAAAGHSWREVGLPRQLSAKAVRRARIQFFVGVPLITGIMVAYAYRRALFGLDYPIRVATAIAMVILGWSLARDFGRWLRPALFRRMDVGTAGTVEFLIRLGTVSLALLVALRIAGLPPGTLAVGGAFTAVIVGLAAQQTLGNLFAGVILLSARPFRVGESVRLKGGNLAGEIEGVVSSLGLLYTIFASGEDSIMVPNNVVLNVAVIPLREPAGVDLRARLRTGVTPMDVQELFGQTVTTPVRGDPQITLEELDGDEVVVRIAATPEHASDGPKLAGEVLAAVAPETRRVETPPDGDDGRGGGAA